jgi:DeoR/GlpR family transcriptional regulator of sugar metabolism
MSELDEKRKRTKNKKQQTGFISLTKKAAEELAKEAVKQFVRPHQVIGLGNGPMAASIIREMANFKDKETLKCIPSSFQIKLEAECSGLKLVGWNQTICDGRLARFYSARHNYSSYSNVVSAFCSCFSLHHSLFYVFESGFIAHH